MSKYKIGDIVRVVKIIGENDSEIPFGTIGTIVDIDDWVYPYEVSFGEEKFGKELFAEEELELHVEHDSIVTNVNIENLENCFNKAIEVNANYVAVVIKMDGFEDIEIIVNPIKNAKKKLEYYRNVYDYSLKHKFSEGISIVGCTYGNSLMDIEFDLIGE